jgi:hypothetical protein
MLEHSGANKKIETYFISLLVILAVLYGCFRAYPLIAGPAIKIYNPHDGDTVASTTFELSGEVKRVKEITINGRPIPIGTDGNFTEIMIAQYPYSILVITATDFYGATVVKTLHVTPR